MKAIWSITGVALMALALTGCFGNSNSGRSSGLAPKVDFTTFVKAEINNPVVDRDPVSLNNKEFVFNDRNNPQAYADLF